MEKIYRNKQVLLLTPHFLPFGGGQEVTIANFLQEFRKKKIQVHILTAAKEGKQREEKYFDDGYFYSIERVAIRYAKDTAKKTVYFDMHNRISFMQKPKMAIEGVSTLQRFYAYAKRFVRNTKKRDITILCHSITMVLVAKRVRRKFPHKRIKIVFLNHFVVQKSSSFLLNTVTKKILQNIDTILCLSQYAQDKMAEMVSGDVFQYTIWNDVLNYEPTKSVSKGDNAIRVLFVGRMVPQKGIYEMMNLMNYIYANNLSKKYTFTFIGDSDHPAYAQLVSLSEKYDFMEVLGRKEKPDIWKYYASHDVFLFPSRWDEAAGNVSLESYACGMPVVASDKGGISEYVKKFPLYGIVNDLQPKTLLSAIEKVYNRLQKMGRSTFKQLSKQVLEKEYSSKNVEVLLDAV